MFFNELDIDELRLDVVDELVLDECVLLLLLSGPLQ